MEIVIPHDPRTAFFSHPAFDRDAWSPWTSQLREAAVGLPAVDGEEQENQIFVILAGIPQSHDTAGDSVHRYPLAALNSPVNVLKVIRLNADNTCLIEISGETCQCLSTCDDLRPMASSSG